MRKRPQQLKRYFEERSLRLSSVNIDIAKYKISKIFDEGINYSTIKLLSKQKDSLSLLLNHYSKKEQDARTGEETYGYDNIYGTLDYISDRWMCPYRIKWILDLIEKEELWNS